MNDGILPDTPMRKRASRAGNAATAAYNQEYAKKNAERLKAYRSAMYHATKDEKRSKKAEVDKEYRDRNKAEIRARRKAKLQSDEVLRAKNIERARAWYQANKEFASQKSRALYLKNPEEIKKRVAAYQKANPEQTRMHHRVKANRRRARLAEAGGVPYTKQDVEELMVLQKCKCASCGGSIKDRFHIDHRQPVAKGGTNERSNIELLCPTCNMHKADKLPHIFAQEQGRLL